MDLLFSIFNLAYSDTITKIIEKYKPTYLFLVIGLNELYAKFNIKNNVSNAAKIYSLFP